MYFSTDAEKESLPKNVLGVGRCIFLLLFKSNVFNVSDSAESWNARGVLHPVWTPTVRDPGQFELRQVCALTVAGAGLLLQCTLAARWLGRSRWGLQ